jgi:hypothetical protein
MHGLELSSTRDSCDRIGPEVVVSDWLELIQERESTDKHAWWPSGRPGVTTGRWLG